MSGVKGRRTKLLEPPETEEDKKKNAKKKKWDINFLYNLLEAIFFLLLIIKLQNIIKQYTLFFIFIYIKTGC
jgi:hypothetical protein